MGGFYNHLPGSSPGQKPTPHARTLIPSRFQCSIATQRIKPIAGRKAKGIMGSTANHASARMHIHNAIETPLPCTDTQTNQAIAQRTCLWQMNKTNYGTDTIDRASSIGKINVLPGTILSHALADQS